jgi:DNA-binding PadR family transcriptional regulator
MSYQLLLLGLLAEQPRHGYEIKQHFEEGTFAEYVKVSGGGLYYNLHKLVKEGYVAEQTIEREGNYPERYVYEITGEGQKQLYRLVGETLGDIKGRKFFDPLDAALLFGTILPKEAVIIRLQRHIDRLKAKLVEIQLVYDSLSSVHGKVVNEPYMLLLLDHSLTRVKSDLEWLQKAQKQIKDEEAFSIAHREKQPVSALIQGESQPRAVPNPENIRIWRDYDAQNEKMLQRYILQIEQAWNEYEVSEKIFINSKKQLEAAQLEYDRKVQHAWEKYQAEVAGLWEKIEAFIQKSVPPTPAS